MSDQIVLLLPVTDFMHQDHYDLLDSILTSAGFSDEGFYECQDHSFRKFIGNETILAPLTLTEIFPMRTRNLNDNLVIYTQNDFGEKIALQLAANGIFFSGIAKFGNEQLWQFEIEKKHLPILAKLCKNELTASRHVIEEYSYFKFLERGQSHGCDLEDWFVSEYDTTERMKKILLSLS